MGSRVVRAIKDDPEYLLLCVEPSEARRGRLPRSELAPLVAEQVASKADVAVLAVPDVLVGKVSAQIEPLRRFQAMVLCLDLAAPYAVKLPLRKDISYFVTRPAHPPVFNNETDLEARRDFFGSGKTREASVAKHSFCFDCK